VIACGALLAAAAGCRQDMQDQPRVDPLESSAFFSDGRASRPEVEGTVARGHLHEDRLFFTGKDAEGKPVEEMPFPVTMEVLERGRERFDIFCSPCHDRTGGGRGMVVRRGLSQPPSFHIERLRKAEIGYFFDVMTNGFGRMYPYADQVPEADRWMIAAYIRALQLSQAMKLEDLDPEERARLDSGPPTPQPSEPPRPEEERTEPAAPEGTP